MKFPFCFLSHFFLLSLPLRECGLKFLDVQHLQGIYLSLPLRECGLKSSDRTIDDVCREVTPLAGVWIEILILSCIFLHLTVTPLAGVWIEIMQRRTIVNMPSVTPLAGVWIEISASSAASSGTPSLPLRECGLKYSNSSHMVCLESHSPCGSVD